MQLCCWTNKELLIGSVEMLQSQIGFSIMQSLLQMLNFIWIRKGIAHYQQAAGTMSLLQGLTTICVFILLAWCQPRKGNFRKRHSYKANYHLPFYFILFFYFVHHKHKQNGY